MRSVDFFDHSSERISDCQSRLRTIVKRLEELYQERREYDDRETIMSSPDVRREQIGAVSIPAMILLRHQVQEELHAVLDDHAALLFFVSSLSRVNDWKAWIESAISETTPIDRDDPDSRNHAGGDLNRAVDRTKRWIAALEDFRRQQESPNSKRSDRLLSVLEDLSVADDSHRRGYLLERLIGETFKFHGVPFWGPLTRNRRGEQIDGAFKLEGVYYLVECRWRRAPSSPAELDAFTGKVSRSGKQTMGLFFSMGGWSTNVPTILALGPVKATILMDGLDLRTVLEGRIGLAELIAAKTAALNIHAKPFLSAVECPGSKPGAASAQAAPRRRLTQRGN